MRWPALKNGILSLNLFKITRSTMSKKYFGFTIFLAALLIIFGASSVLASGGKMPDQSISLVIDSNYVVKLKADSVVGAIRTTTSAPDTLVSVPYYMWATDTSDNSGLDIVEFQLVVYYDSADIEYKGFSSENWDEDSIEITHTVDTGTIMKIVVHGINDTCQFSASTWSELFVLEFMINCNSNDEVWFDLDVDYDDEENYVKVSGGGQSNEALDDNQNGAIGIMAYWGYLNIGEAETLLGEENIEVIISLDSNNFRIAVMSYYLEYDTAVLHLDSITGTDAIDEWNVDFYPADSTLVNVINTGVFYYLNESDTAVEINHLWFTNKAASDSIYTTLHCPQDSSNVLMGPVGLCWGFYDAVDVYTDNGQIAIPEYEFDVELEFLDNGGEGDTVTLAVLAKSNFPAGPETNDTADVRILLDYDECLTYITSTDYCSTAFLSIGKVPGYDKAHINFSSGYLAESDSLDTLCTIEFEIEDDCGLGCPEALVVDFDTYHNLDYRCRAVDTTNQVVCGNIDASTTNDKMVLTPDTLEINCGEIYVNQVSDTNVVKQPVKITHGNDIGSVELRLDYNNTHFYYYADSSTTANGISISTVDANTLEISGSSLNWGADENVWLATIGWCAKSTGSRTMTTNVYNSVVVNIDGDTVNAVTELDSNATVITPGYMRPYCEPPDEWDLREQAELPKKFQLCQNRPNPFNPITVINFDLPEACQVRLEVFNLLGQRVESLVDDYLDAGNHSITWDTRQSNVSSGIYFYRIEAGKNIESKKMLLLK
ncbi:MAG: T9SS type A sorting domain-containing protein [candidate division Zixibacteria bacterium]|nr:T9SS type A sorting domain-containing protein [candidate division Zixibacteria bacterium]